MYKKLMMLAEKLNIIAGVGGAEPFDVEKEALSDVPFVKYSYEERTNPALTMADAKSLIAIGLPYNTVYEKINDNKLRGIFSSGAVGEDYHITVTNILNTIKNEILEGFDVMIFADTGPLIDREVAKRCGLGYVGKHYGIINDKIGSMFFIGYAITNVPFEKWNVKNNDITDNCGECRNCITACPTGAIGENSFNYKNCISYITQKSGLLTDIEARSIKTQIYGCDVCQRVCVKNKFKKSLDEYAYPDIEELLNISNKDFDRIYKKTAAGWRGKKILQRNAVIALGNLKDKRALPLIKKLKEDTRIEIKSAAEWAEAEILKGK